MENKDSRTEMLLGIDALNKLKKSRVAVFGVGGVGGFAVEALARTGVGCIDIFDDDTIKQSNLNRQIIALSDTIGLDKVETAKNRINNINPQIKVNANKIFFNKDSNIDLSVYDYIIDAIDTVSSKLYLVCKANSQDVPIISCMGTGNKLNPEMLEVTDIYKTSVCPLAKVMRYELKKLGVKSLKVVYSKEEPIKPKANCEEFGRHIPASAIFVPGAAGLILAAEAIKHIISK